MSDLERLFELAKRKHAIDQQSGWGEHGLTYLNDIKAEVDEVLEERPRLRRCYLEDELADVIWNYVNVLTAFEHNGEIEINSLLKRACDKYQQRVDGIESGIKWQQIKVLQQQQLANEHQQQLTKELDTK